MEKFIFVSLETCPEADAIFLSDLYFKAGIIDSPKDYFKNLAPTDQEEILKFYRSGKFFKITYAGETIGYIGHGTKLLDTVMIFYIFLPEFRGQGLFRPMIDQFSVWCRGKYPDKKFLQANTEATNLASISSLEKAGFHLLKEQMDGPHEREKVLFRCYRRNIN